jgi:predicted Na+-dependent transporter
MQKQDNYMDERAGNTRYIVKKLLEAVLVFVVAGMAAPLIIGLITGISSGQILTLVTSIFILQAAAPPVGLAIGLSSLSIIVIMGFFAFGITLSIFSVCQGLAETSERVSSWITRLRNTTDKYPQIQKYGALSCIFIAWIPGIGLYGTPVIAWLMKWRKFPSILFTVTGFLVASIFVLYFSSKITEILLFVAQIGVIIFIVASVCATGFSVTKGNLQTLLNDKRFILAAFIANALIVPVVAYLVAISFQLHESILIGLVLVGCSAGSVFLPRAVQIGGPYTGRAAAFSAVFMMLSAVILIPLLFILAPGLQPLHPYALTAALILLVIIPFTVATGIRSRKEIVAVRISRWMSAITYIAFIATFIAVFLVNNELLPGVIGTDGIIAAILFVLIAFGSGYLLSGREPGNKSVLSFGTAQRHIAIAAAVAYVGFDDPLILVTVLGVGIIGLIILWIIGRVRANTAVPL